MDKTTVGQTKNAGYQIGARRTLAIHPDDAWRLLTSPEGLSIWLHPQANLELIPGAYYKLPDGCAGEVRVFKPGSHLRITWHPAGWERASTLQVRVIASGAKTVIAFHQEHLPDPGQREERRRFFTEALDKIEAVLS